MPEFDYLTPQKDANAWTVLDLDQIPIDEQARAAADTGLEFPDTDRRFFVEADFSKGWAWKYAMCQDCITEVEIPAMIISDDLFQMAVTVSPKIVPLPTGEVEINDKGDWKLGTWVTKGGKSQGATTVVSDFKTR